MDYVAMEEFGDMVQQLIFPIAAKHRKSDCPLQKYVGKIAYVVFSHLEGRCFDRRRQFVLATSSMRFQKRGSVTYRVGTRSGTSRPNLSAGFSFMIDAINLRDRAQVIIR
jgi:hypothetical protein